MMQRLGSNELLVKQDRSHRIVYRRLFGEDSADRA